MESEILVAIKTSNLGANNILTQIYYTTCLCKSYNKFRCCNNVLGMFDQSVFLNQNISNLISLKRSQRSLNKIWKSNFSVDLKRNLVSESVLLYGSNLWTLTEKLERN